MSAALQIALPDIGDYRDVPVIELLVKPGDRLAVDDLILSIESDKATMEVPSPVAGIVRELLVAVGSKVSEGTPILTVEPAEGGGAAPVPDTSPAVAASAPPDRSAAPLSRAGEGQGERSGHSGDGAPLTPPLSRTADGVGRASSEPIQATRGDVHASPSVRQLARELGVGLDRVAATGPKGRILREDVHAFVKAALGAPAQAPVAASGIGAGLPPWPEVDFAKYGPVRREPLSRIQSLSGANLSRNWLTIPHVTNFDRADVTEIESFRLGLNKETRTPPARVTMVAFLIKAAASALRAYPRFNASLEGGDLVLKDYVHVGFAVDTPKGLMVPVVRDCDRKGLIEIATEMAAMAEKARSGTLPGSDMQGGCFSVSSLGGIGGDGFTPIINAPEVAILGAARSRTEAVWDGKAFQPRLILPLSLSWDHRVVDGVAAARFLGHVASVLSDLRRALL
ncbi:2-oxo acid dehydrogenase subunit E2 [Methylobacterium radiotolerans]|jgi:pyruvate dehydrogenase E2 component (dihydrolipoamide acetyltransferase)|uniref:2-oxo acid dehydrogenase subunit E2 n=1 Tax=Methylobacterium TaxID=407 RepID=UPI0005E713C8|nr:MULTISPECIES: 2-oxo acid dehydrogenase subunit E2 [Methylobacterium]KTS08891.1 branched-chain alpha-keto acid dehydrogenase subunit E2 [Methylobacterium radiotolerans]MBN6819597.1 2-oxo acid dehydrogenase subunit E2 [Methylobacterium organophilum]OXE43762.1 branched-chain alpha-keto acid dehydrogenase subunit E2 [Methylobacterium radiotolerans]GAN49230.1 dihydrolipoamide acetyltransferase-like protein [Methylobacterium sp. ME121]